MNRTYGAALISAVVVGGSLTGLGVFLGFPTTPSVWFGVVCGLLAGLLLIGASRRADTFHPTDPNAHLADHSDATDRPHAVGGSRGPSPVDEHLDPGPAAERSAADDDPDDPPAGAARG